MEQQGLFSDSPLVSVVMPVYNVEPFVQKSLDCIRNQTYKNLEIICIDDGSTDGSLQILNDNALTDSRIRVFHQSNQGLAATRNIGVRYAEGEYIYFMDSDDYFEPDAITKLLAYAGANDLEMVTFDADAFTEETEQEHLNQKYNRWYQRDDEYISPCKGSELFKNMVNKNQFVAPVWLHFFRKDFIEKNELWFHPGILMEDFPITAAAFLSAERMGYLHEVFFHRRVRAGSIMTSPVSFRHVYGYFIGALDLTDYIEKYKPELDAAEWEALGVILQKRLRIAREKFCLLDENEKKKAEQLPPRERILFGQMVGNYHFEEKLGVKGLARLVAKRIVLRLKKTKSH